MLTHDELQAVRLTVQVALVAVVVSLPLAIGLGWLLARRNFPGKWALETLVNLPLVLPPVVTGYFLLVTFGRQGPLGRWLEEGLGLRFVFDWKGASLASAVVAFPLFVRPIRLAFSALDPRLELTARTLGASRWDAFWTISLPLARRGIIAGAILGFARGVGEFGATIMIAGSIPGQTRTIPLFIYNELDAPGGVERAAPLIWLSVAIAAAALIVGEFLNRRQPGGGAAGR